MHAQEHTAAISKLRSIEARVRGQQQGPIVRLISPGDWGERLKPFIFLDFFNAEIEPGFGFGMHPHSGIATLTWQPGSDVHYQDTTGKNGILKAGGLEWMNAGGGAWHRGSLLGRGQVTGFQLWVPMPPGIESGPAFGQYVEPDTVPILDLHDGIRVRILLGTFGGCSSPINSHQDMTYLAIDVPAGATWIFSPAVRQTIAWAFSFAGHSRVQGADTNHELLILGEEGDLEIAAIDYDARVLVGFASPHDHPLICGPSSVHTNHIALEAGLRRIQEIGEHLRDSGDLA